LLGPGELGAYRAGGTWRSIFDPGSWPNRLPVVFWVAGLIAAGLIAFPFVWLVGGPLPDRGWAFTRPIGLLLVSWLAWWGASLRLVVFSRGGVLLATALMAAGAAVVAWRRRHEIWLWVRGHARLLLFEEALFWSAFLALLLVRWANPDLWHPTLGGEKPMDFAYLNAVIKSTYFPPFDPWLAGGYLNYYYFGFVLVAVLTRVTAIVPSVAYNLAIPAFFSFVALGAFSVSLSLVSGRGSRPPARRLLGFAVLGAVFVGLAGNLAELRLIGSFAVGLFTGHSPLGIERWYWDASRVIHHPISEAGPITEFPAFTFLFADLHAHLLALPYTIVVLGLAVAFVRGAATPLHPLIGWARLALLALVLGALWTINAWDVPAYALLAVAAVAVASGRRPLSVAWLRTVPVRVIALLLLSYALFLPFHLRYASGFAGIAGWNGSQTPLGDYLTIHGLFLFCIVAAMLVDLWFARDLNPAARLLRLGLKRWRRLRRLAHLHERMVHVSPGYGLGLFGLGLGALFFLGFLLFKKPVPALIVGLMTLGALLLIRRGRPDQLDDLTVRLWQSTLVMVVLGLGLTLAVEFFVAASIDIGRMNTVFKTYLQVWVLFGIAAAVSARVVFQRLPHRRPRLYILWSSGFAVLLAVALLYPILATPARVADRFDRSVGPSLNGMLFLDRAIYADHGQRFPLAPDGEAIRWMQHTLVGSPVIAEVNTAPTLYGWGNRYAVFTGNPAVVGWDWHQRQQRPILAPLIARRVEDIQLAYRTPDPGLAHQILARYGVGYIVVGPLERAYFPEGVGKWEAAVGTYWTTAYANSGVVIYAMIEIPSGPKPPG
jgi:YYY domain-containing protein